jgi:AhpD family alkylhydroperoxidase
MRRTHRQRAKVIRPLAPLLIINSQHHKGDCYTDTQLYNLIPPGGGPRATHQGPQPANPPANSFDFQTGRGLAELVAVGASLAVNCTSNIDKHLTAARALGVPQDHVNEVIALVALIRAKAIGHAEARLGGGKERAPAASCAETMASAKCC